MAHVLVVEDDLTTRLLFVAVLRRAGVSCSEAADGASAIAALASREFDAVLLDLVLPQASGYDVLNAIRASQPDLVGRVIVCSALPVHHMAGDELRGVAAIFAKPPDIEALAEAVATVAAGTRV